MQARVSCLASTGWPQGMLMPADEIGLTAEKAATNKVLAVLGVCFSLNTQHRLGIQRQPTCGRVLLPPLLARLRGRSSPPSLLVQSHSSDTSACPTDPSSEPPTLQMSDMSACSSCCLPVLYTGGAANTHGLGQC
jgi:hypothetical protein